MNACLSSVERMIARLGCVILALIAVVSVCTEARSIVYASLVDYDPKTGSVLMRSSGAAEVLPPHFNETGLIDELRLACVKAGVPFPENFTLQSVNLLSFAPELPELEVEKEYFEKHPEVGNVVHWPLQGICYPETMKEGCKEHGVSNCEVEKGAYGQPRNFSSQDILALAKGFGVDWAVKEQLDERVEQLHAWLTTPAALPRVIAVHCHHGTDRTGEMISSYEMKYLNRNFQDFMRSSSELTGRGMYYCTQLAAQWQCIRERILANQPYDDCIPCDAAGTHASCSPYSSLFWCLPPL